MFCSSRMKRSPRLARSNALTGFAMSWGLISFSSAFEIQGGVPLSTTINRYLSSAIGAAAAGTRWIASTARSNSPKIGKHISISVPLGPVGCLGCWDRGEWVLRRLRFFFLVIGFLR